MGVLDDAIRDHLDLKRRRGADPTEIERAERDALGPVRRGPEPVADEAPMADALPPDEEEVAAPPFDDRPAGELDEDELWADELEPEWEDEPADDHALASEPGSAPPAPAPTPAVPEPHPAAPVSTGDETVEYRMDDAPAHQGSEGSEGQGDDVLEETPEFLQETPDHDRLWFEQRPPRDFDFDG